MSGVPGLFTDEEVVTDAAPSTLANDSTALPLTSEAAPSGKETGRTKRKSQKKNTPEGRTSKKHQVAAVAPSSSVSAVASTFGRLAEKHVLEEEFNAWKARTEDQQRDAMRRASIEMFFHNLTNDDKYQARLKELEAEKHNFKNKTNELRSKLKKTEEEKSAADTSLSNLQTEFDEAVKARDVSLASLKDENVKQADEIKALKADQANSWAEEKKKVKAASFEDGFRSYLKTFMAADPDYDWTSHLGVGMGKWMADFATMEAKAIAAKKIQVQAQLAKEKAQPPPSPQVGNDATNNEEEEAEDVA